MPACPCCGDETLNDQQRRQHMVARWGRLAAALDAMNQDDAGLVAHDAGPAPNDNGPAPNGDSLAPGLAPGDELAPGNDGMVLDEVAPAPDRIDLVALIAREDGSDLGSEPRDDADDMDLDDDLFVPPPEVPPGPGVRWNPPVCIDEWTSEEEPDLANFAPPNADSDNASVANTDRDPEFFEQDELVGLDPDVELDMDDPELWAFLRQYLSDLTHEEWVDMFNWDLTDRDCKSLRFLASRLRTHFSHTTYDDLQLHACEELGLPSDFVAWQRLKILAGLESCMYDCCVLSYTPLIPQLKGLFQNPRLVKEMRHCARHKVHRACEPGNISDIFDGKIYCTLQNTKVREGDDYQYFDLPDDIALGFGTDGFILLIEELLELVEGVEVTKVASEVDNFEGEGTNFVLHAFLIILFGDIPAISNCAPYEMMHLIFENLVPNMVLLWKGKFKWINHDDEAYWVSDDDWNQIGRLTAEATHTIPSRFVSTLLNIDQDMGLYKAKAYSFWFTYLTPILLNGQLDREYYEHFLTMHEIVVLCLELEISGEEVDALEEMINKWVQEYERYFGLTEGPGLTAQQLCDQIDWNTLYELLPDRNADLPNERDQPICVIHYGCVQDVFYVEWIQDLATNAQRPYLLVRVQECNTQGLDATWPENPIVMYNRLDTLEIINLGTVHAIVGRVKVGSRNMWAIIDRSKGARTQFNNEEGDPDLNLD
ncbi:hypothetical protein FRC10_000579 [Ceratobasidium sp. 414]|nr:hypothetical protein FRC10_000579 [Ceratobasidium sp. 414]